MLDQPTRIERDSLGEVHVPADALYGAQTQRAVNNFPISGLRPAYPFFFSNSFMNPTRASTDSRDTAL